MDDLVDCSVQYSRAVHYSPQFGLEPVPSPLYIPAHMNYLVLHRHSQWAVILPSMNTLTLTLVQPPADCMCIV